MTAVAGRLFVDVAAAVDSLGVLDPAAAVKAVKCSIPQSAAVELSIGAATMCLPAAAPLLHMLRPAGSVVVTGTDPAGVADVIRRLRVGFARVAR